jgi:hypothetical protein
MILKKDDLTLGKIEFSPIREVVLPSQLSNQDKCGILEPLDRVLDKSLVENARQTFNECLIILSNKNHDYSKGDDEFRNFKLISKIRKNITPADGIIVRITDKIARIGNLLDLKTEVIRVKDEKLEDTIKDAINYLVILKAWLDSKEN